MAQSRVFNRVSTFFDELQNFATKPNYYETYFYSDSNFFFLPNNNDVFLEKSFFKTSHNDFFASPLQSVTKLDYNSYYVYVYIFMYYIRFFLRYIFDTIFYIQKPAKIFELTQSFNDFFTT
jgi:hypothetical protein